MERFNVATHLQIFGLAGFGDLAKITAYRAGACDLEGKPEDAAIHRRAADAMHGKYLDLLAG